MPNRNVVPCAGMYQGQKGAEAGLRTTLPWLEKAQRVRRGRARHSRQRRRQQPRKNEQSLFDRGAAPGVRYPGGFSHAKPSMSLAEIVAAVRLPKTTVFRVLSSLVERGYCEWDAQTGKYSLGFELVRLADIRRRQSNVHDVAVPVMREIRNEVNETVILSVRSGDSRVHIDFVEGLHPMRRMADLGVRAPLYAGAASKVLLAGMDGRRDRGLSRSHRPHRFSENHHHRPQHAVARGPRDPQARLCREQGRTVSGRRRAGGADQGFFRQDRRGDGYPDARAPLHRRASRALHRDAARRRAARLGAARLSR